MSKIDVYDESDYEDDLKNALDYARTDATRVVQFETPDGGRAFAEYLPHLDTWQVVIEQL